MGDLPYLLVQFNILTQCSVKNVIGKSTKYLKVLRKCVILKNIIKVGICEK